MGQREKRIFLVLGVLALSSFVYDGGKLYAANTKEVPAVSGTYREGIIGQPRYINPILANSETDESLVKLVFSGLYKQDETGNIIPDIAESFPQVSEDGREYTVKLRSNAMWHNGSQVTADDVAFTINTLKNPEYNSPRSGDWQSTVVEALDARTVVFKLNAASGPFLNNLTLPIISKKIWENIAPADFALSQSNIKAIGSGPYTIKEVRKQATGAIQVITLESFEQFYTTPAYVKNLQISFYENIDTVMKAVHGKQIDGFGSSPFSEAVNVIDESSKNLTIHEIPLPQYQAVFFNLSNKIFKDVVVRKALLASTDSTSIINNVYDGHGLLINGPILRQHVDGIPEPINTTNVDAANKMLDDAGWSIKSGAAVRSKNGVDLAFTLSTNDFSLNSKTAELLAAQWQKIGAQITLNIQSTKDLTESSIRPRAFDALLFAQKLGNDPDPFLFWHSSQVKNPGLNLSGYANNEADRLMSEARATTDKALRDEKYRQFQTILQADVPAIFIAQNVFSYAITDQIKGFHITDLSDETARFYDLPNWYLDTKRILKK